MNNLKTSIKEEINRYLISHSEIFSDNTIDLFLNILERPLDDPSSGLEGLQTRVPNAMRKILIENINKDDKSSFFPEFVKIEPFFKKIIFFLDPPKFQEISSSRSGLANSINYLGLNQSGIKLSSTYPESHLGDPNFLDHILRLYHLRNIESHQCKAWSNKELYENIESALIVYLYTVYVHSSSLRNIISPKPQFNTYLEKVVKDFDLWKERFVHITGIERFDEIPIHAIEREKWGEKEAITLREGKIDELRKSIEENVMVILGEPGMGKSTSMQYMAYNDAKNMINTPEQEGRIPVYIELKLLSKDETIINFCSTRLDLPSSKIIELFNDGKITLFLDGLNEVFVELRVPLRKEIQKLIAEHKNIYIIITSRPLAYSDEFKEVPVFNLQRLNDSQVQEFLQKNCKEERLRTILFFEINNNNRLGKIVRVPLLLKMLINVVLHNSGTIPANKTQIISEFIYNIYRREKEKQIETIDLRIIHRLLCFLGHCTRKENSSNVGWRIEQFETIIENRIEKSRFDLNVYQFIDTATDLHLLVKDGNKYSFIHELYQEYFASEELFRLNTI